MYPTLDSFLEDWQDESALTAKLLHAVTDASLGQSVTDEDRTLGRVAWHIVTTLPEMLGRTGLDIASPAHEAPVPRRAADIAAAYEKAAAELAALMRCQWTDATLDIEDDMYGEVWSRRVTLEALVRHEIHHRGQMTVLMRQAGLAVPGIYGPAREEWAAMGMKPPSV